LLFELDLAAWWERFDFLLFAGVVADESLFMLPLELAAGGVWVLEAAGGVVWASAGSAAIVPAASTAARRETLEVIADPCPWVGPHTARDTRITA
jgi:hypothetical protein